MKTYKQTNTQRDTHIHTMTHSRIYFNESYLFFHCQINKPTKNKLTYKFYVEEIGQKQKLIRANHSCQKRDQMRFKLILVRKGNRFFLTRNEQNDSSNQKKKNNNTLTYAMIALNPIVMGSACVVAFGPCTCEKHAIKIMSRHHNLVLPLIKKPN